ncbi:nascent polypeptide-associated complex subunit alpha, muscle-specific form isoform X2 [Ctenopharyngodon idella]|uniref:nascent polypeptide-associated complex subunit alpha, muscle-specific form isoform X2 n=1 Tax=Ctenopharyngodon idella TaxID=7959 RepID=UPI002230257D|nr:nascent polypeptide-associated complex subunit alpha, muscle-specific form isoform X2 [Ctenopharyngodon idella]
MSARPAELKMGSDQYRSSHKINCVLCKKSDEDEITGPLSSKENISAHQNCLLFASGIYCKNSPTYDDLFGFDVDDVKDELRRGKRLLCHHCNKNGATAGCENKRCRRSYHYPCAIEANAKAIEDFTEGSYKLLCELHDSKSKGTSSVNLQEASTSGLSGSNKKRKSADSHGRRRPDRSESNSSTGSSEVSLSRKKKRKSALDLTSSQQFSESDDDVEPMFAPVESDVEECTPPKQHNQSTPDPERKGPREELNPSATGSLNGGLTSDQKACGSADNPGELHGRSTSDLPKCSPELETPRRKKRKYIVYSDDESPIGTNPVVAPVASDLEESLLPKQPNSTPVPENTRPCEKLNLSTTGEDDDDTDIELEKNDNKNTTQGHTKPQWHIGTKEVSQSLLQLERYHTTAPFTVIVDSGLSAESEYSLEPGSPVSADPEAVCLSPGSVSAPEHEDETPSTSRTSLAPRAPPTDTVSPGTVESQPDQHCDSEGLLGQPESPQRSSPTVDVPMMVTSAVRTLSASDFNIKQQPEPFPPAGVSTSPDRPAASDAFDVNSTGPQSNATIFWTRCNQAGWTKEIFSELVSQLSSLGERVQSQEASHQDYDVALKLLETSGQLPRIITQLEQDLEKQKRDLRRKKTALRDARAVLGV